MNKPLAYLENMKAVLDSIMNEQLIAIEKCAAAFAAF